MNPSNPLTMDSRKELLIAFVEFAKKYRDSSYVEPLSESGIQTFLSSLPPQGSWIKVQAVQDGDSHWYIIPNELCDEFHSLIQRCDNGDDDSCMEADERFGQYRTGGDLNQTQLYLPPVGDNK